MMLIIKSIWASLWRIVSFLILWGLLYAPFIISVSKKLGRPNSIQSLPLRLYVEAAGLVAILISAWGMMHFIDRCPFISLGFEPKMATRDIFIGLSVGAGILLVPVAFLHFGGWIEWYPSGTVIWLDLTLAGLAMLFNTVTQEILFRGYILQTIRARGGTSLAIILSSVIFSLVHLPTARNVPLAVFNIFLTGFLYGYARIITRNLWLPIGMHFIWNFLLGPILGLTVSGRELGCGWRLLTLKGPILLTGGNFGLEGGLVVTGTTVVGLLAIYLLYKRQYICGNWVNFG